LIATNRSGDCGGEYSGSERRRQQTLIEAAKKGADYIDVELSAPGLKDVIREALRRNVKPIISSHDFDETRGMEELEETLKKEIASGADVCKIVTTARSITDNLKVLEFTSRASKKSRIVCFSMGQLGKPSRLMSPIFGALFTIASLDGENGTASGQLTLQEARAAYKALGFV
jgi:3-dehydroquinate dehydratase-1